MSYSSQIRITSLQVPSLVNLSFSSLRVIHQLRRNMGELGNGFAWGLIAYYRPEDFDARIAREAGLAVSLAKAAHIQL